MTASCGVGVWRLAAWVLDLASFAILTVRYLVVYLVLSLCCDRSLL
jgi:hypothetical protein